MPASPPALDAPDAAARKRERQDVLLGRLAGKKVSVSTRDLHHVVGRLVEITADDLHLEVRGRPVRVRRSGLCRIHEADPALAEFVK